MQLLKASALLPAVDDAAWRSQSDASRLRLFVLWLSLGKGLLLSYGPDEYGRGGAQPAKSIDERRLCPDSINDFQVSSVIAGDD